MAFTLKIEGNFFVIFNTASPFSEVFRSTRAQTSFVYYQESAVDYFEFKALGANFIKNVVKYDFTDLIDSRTGVAFSSVALLRAFLSLNLGIESQNVYSGLADKFVFISSPNDFPSAVANVRTLEANVTYFITANIDLAGDRLVGSEKTTIIGGSSENCTLTSTGLGVGVALFTSVWTTPIRHISFINVDTGVSIDGTGNNAALDWSGVNFVNIPKSGILKDVDNFIFNKGAFLESGLISYTGTIGTVAFTDCLFRQDTNAKLFDLQAGLTITRRFRVIYSSFIVSGERTALDLNASAIIPDESLILENNNFSGGGVYLTGIDAESNKALFIRNVGIENTSANGQLYMQNNAVATTVAAVDTFYKIAGTTTLSDDNSKFSHTNNRLTCTATISRKYLIQANLTFTAGNNNVCEFGFYDSQIPGIRVPSKTKSTANAGGRAENIPLVCVVRMKDGDFIEVHGANSSLADITVESLNFVITEIN